MNFSLVIQTGNAAFDEQSRALEVARMLRAVSRAVGEYGMKEGKCRDSNGNTVGEWSLD